MGRNVYLFALKEIRGNRVQVCDNLLAKGYSLVKDEGKFGIYLEKELPYGIIEAHINDDISFVRIAKPNSVETIAVLLKDILSMKSQFPNTILYDMEDKQVVVLNDEETLKKKFLNAREEFLTYFSNIINKAPVRGDDVFKK